MPHTGNLIEIVVVLAGIVVFVPIFKRLGIGPVLGYLVAGVAIGPSGLALIADQEGTRALAELGVVFLLFTVGLELPVSRFKVIPRSMLGLGVAQIVVTAAAIGAVAWAAGVDLAGAMVVGMGLALSSTTVVVRLLSDRGDLTSRFGRLALTVLLLQDLAVGPFLVAVIALGGPGGSMPALIGLALLKAVLALAGIILVGRVAVLPLFRWVAASAMPEVFAALTLLVALAAALVTHQAGLSLGFGAFLAGVLLADTGYRHQIAAEISPFRGLLLGLFFITVGTAVDLDLAARNAAPIALMAVALIVGKCVILGGLARMFGLSQRLSLQIALYLAQGGEFSFVLLGAGLAAGILAPPLGDMVTVAVILTMMVTPFLASAAHALGHRLKPSGADPVFAAEQLEDMPADHVVIAGFGRVGRAAAHRLGHEHVPFIAVDLDPHGVTEARRDGLPVYYGDACRPEVLQAVGVARARAVVVALNDPDAAVRLVTLLRYIFPELTVYSRAYDDSHAEELRLAGSEIVVPEMIATGTQLANSVLERAET